MKTNGPIAKFYKWSYGIDNYQLPTNLCPFFWKYIFALISLPIYVIPMSIGSCLERLIDGTWPEWKQFDMKGRWLSVLVMVLILLALAALGGIGYVFINSFIVAPKTTGALCVLVLFLVFLGYWAKVKDYNPKLGEFLVENIDLVINKVSSTKKNYCPTISWDDENEDW